MRVLVVEDDDLIASGILAGLLAHGIQAQCAGNVAEAEAAFFENTFDALVLDLGLPDQDGMSFLQMLRRCGEQLPVIIVTARDGVEHRLAGLHGGADDYLIKPFDLRELAARLHVVVRRAQGRAVQRISAGPLEIEPQTRQVWLEGEGIELSRREVDLLVHLFDAGGRWIPAAASVNAR